ncbi:MAG TPA: acyl-CoA carboxylase subunit epsilon [Streptosporangiaceae bacterium]|nr:acyl-CoA carboxylase subunit epsilon [Streptosporangiaceae bacterium]
MTGPEPLFSVMAGQPTPEELAALTVVLARVLAARSAAAQAASYSGTKPGHWADRSHLLRVPLTPGPGAWRRSALPH